MSGTGESVAVTERTRLHRERHKGRFDRPTIDAILDEALVCHLGFVHDGQPYVIPTLHARRGDELLVHGSSASRMLRLASRSVEVCATVTLVDGIVLARSAFGHSINYRSVVVLGRARWLGAPDEKLTALEAFTERVVPGRWSDVRPPTDAELKATTVLSLPIAEASAKVRSGPPDDPPEDLDFATWAGVVPIELRALAPEPDPLMRTPRAAPRYVLDYQDRLGERAPAPNGTD